MKQRPRSIEWKSMRTQLLGEWVLGESAAGPPEGHRLLKPISERLARTVTCKKKKCVILQRHQFQVCTLVCWSKLAKSEPSQVPSIDLSVSLRLTMVSTLYLTPLFKLKFLLLVWAAVLSSRPMYPATCRLSPLRSGHSSPAGFVPAKFPISPMPFHRQSQGQLTSWQFLQSLRLNILVLSTLLIR